ncbi:unnamed protein product [Rodentolepis nana]|uniref:Flocculation protein FLO11-like n=1 Tax=Rodentolepis nana TaxID=102285 RepID=A0A0R3TSF8_RODNA|nr:unnamed protein product [Rodentolepis nana]
MLFLRFASFLELYGQPSWWGDGDSDEGGSAAGREKEKRPLSRPCSVEPSRKVSPNGHTSITPQDKGKKVAESFIIELEATVRATPRRQAEAFTIDLKGEGASSCASGSVCVPERLRRALQERQQSQKKHSIPTDRPSTAPINKKTPLKKAGEPPRLQSKSGQVGVTKLPARPKTGIPRSPAASPIASPKNIPRRTTGTAPVASKVKTTGITPATTIQKKESTNSKTPHPPNPLTQRNRIPLRQAPSKTPAVTKANGTRKNATGRAEASPTLPSLSASPSAVKTSRLGNIPGTPVASTVQSNRALLKRGSGPISEVSGIKRSVGSPVTRQITSSVRTASGVGGRQATPTRTTVSENKRLPLASQNTTRVTKAPAVPNAHATAATHRQKPTRPLFNSIKKPITTTTTSTNSSTSIIGLPTKPILNGSTICDPLIQEIWSYKEAKDYVLEKMFQGIAATYNSMTSSKSTTQSIFEEFKAAATQSAATTAAIKAVAGMTAPTPKPASPINCTPEERQELQLFERVEAEIDKLGGDGDEEALVKALSPLVEDFGKTWIRGKNVSKSVEVFHTPIEKLPVVDNSSDPNLGVQIMSAAASTVTLENPLTNSGDHKADPDSLQNAESFQSIAETYVLDANDTLAAEGIPPVVIFDSMEKLHMEARDKTDIMETSNTCTLPYQETSTSGTPLHGEESDEIQALEIFEKEINDEFKAEADSLSLSEDLDAKSNGSGSGQIIGNSRRQEASAVPEYLVKTPCWSEKREGSKKSQNQSRPDKSWTISAPKSEASKKTDSHFVISKHATSPDQVSYNSKNSGAVYPDEKAVGYPVSQITQTSGVSQSTNTSNQLAASKTLPTSHGRIFVADDPPDFLNGGSTSTSSSSSSSPLIDHFKEKFLQPKIQPTHQIASFSFDRRGNGNKFFNSSCLRIWFLKLKF